ncbi:MAG: hypothetical protein ACR2IE_01530 [Candidatus Sumerlaeaceae bacterium]
MGNTKARRSSHAIHQPASQPTASGLSSGQKRLFADFAAVFIAGLLILLCGLIAFAPTRLALFSDSSPERLILNDDGIFSQLAFAHLWDRDSVFNSLSNPYFVKRTNTDRKYANLILITRTGNFDPTAAIQPNGNPQECFGLDPSLYFRFFGHCQFKWKVRQGIAEEIIDVNNSSFVKIGPTQPPCLTSFLDPGVANYLLEGEIGEDTEEIQITDGFEFCWGVKTRACSLAQTGFQNLNRRELPWAMFKFRFSSNGDLISNLAGPPTLSPDPSLSPDAPLDYSTVPTIRVFHRYWDVSEFKVEPFGQVTEDYMQFLTIGNITGTPYYPGF